MLNNDGGIEKYLENLGLEPKYRVVILELSTYVTPILNFIPQTIPNYTDHGTRHSLNILANILKFKKNLTQVFPSFSFSQEELFLLALSAYVHDIGCIVGRKEHNKHSARLLTEDSCFSFLHDKIGADLLGCLKLTVLAHSSDFNLNKLSKERSIENVRLRLICAIFRLMDACEVSAARISKTLYDILVRNGKLKHPNTEFWEGHLSIIDLFFEKQNIVIACDDASKPIETIKHLEEDLVAINKVFEGEKFPLFKLKVINLGYE